MQGLQPLYVQRLIGTGLYIDNDKSIMRSALFIYGATVFAMIAVRPRPIYDENGRIRKFGSGKDDTIIPFPIAAAVPAIVYMCLRHEAMNV